MPPPLSQGPYDVHCVVPDPFAAAGYDLEVRFLSGRRHSKATLPVLGGLLPMSLWGSLGSPPLVFVRDVPAIVQATS
jgi:hypothetical protein